MRAEILAPPAVLGLSNTDVGRRRGLLGQQSAFTDKQAQRGEMRRYIRPTARGEQGGVGMGGWAGSRQAI